MQMKCISVYTNNFGTFSDIYEDVMATTFTENEEKEFEGIVASESGDVPDNYISRMKLRSEVVVMKIKEQDVTILQHGDVFEILIPAREKVLS